MKFFKSIILASSILLIAGCVAIESGEARSMETRVVGVDLSVPIVGMPNQNLINLRFGYIEVKVAHTRDANLTSNANQDVSFFNGKGVIKRIFSISMPDKK
jgi:hypothetical protein